MTERVALDIAVAVDDIMLVKVSSHTFESDLLVGGWMAQGTAFEMLRGIDASWWSGDMSLPSCCTPYVFPYYAPEYDCFAQWCCVVFRARPRQSKRLLITIILTIQQSLSRKEHILLNGIHFAQWSTTASSWSMITVDW